MNRPQMEAESYIKSLQLDIDQLKMLRAIHVLIQIYDNHNRREMEEKFTDFEVSIKKYFAELINGHLVSADDMINKFYGIWYRDYKLPSEIHSSLEQLVQNIKSMKT